MTIATREKWQEYQSLDIGLDLVSGLSKTYSG